jgi:hypothetical protein
MPEASEPDPRRVGERAGDEAPETRGVRDIPEDPGSTPAKGTPPLGDDETPEQQTTTPGLGDDVGAPPHETSGEDVTADPPPSGDVGTPPQE